MASVFLSSLYSSDFSIYSIYSFSIFTPTSPLIPLTHLYQHTIISKLLPFIAQTSHLFHIFTSYSSPSTNREEEETISTRNKHTLTQPSDTGADTGLRIRSLYCSGFVSIDCGATKDYLDDGSGIFYQSDTDFIDTGTNSNISPENQYSNQYYGRQLKNLRSSPHGTKNCYTLKPEQGKNSSYLIRAFFFYGNYDNENQAPKFNLYVGLNYWMTVYTQNMDVAVPTFPDVIYVPTSDIIYVCLINTGFGIPFISALELRPLNKSLYPIDEGALYDSWRYNLGTSSDDKDFVRKIIYSFFLEFGLGFYLITTPKFVWLKY